MLTCFQASSSPPPAAAAALPSPAPLKLRSLASSLRCQPSSPSAAHRRRRRRRSRSGAGMGAVAASSNGSLAGLGDQKPAVPRRKVIEHIAVFQMKKEFDEIQEKDMLDHLYTLQYQLRGILSVSLGTITGSNPDGYTHALFSRFPSKEDLKTYYESPIRWKIANEYIIPYYNGMLCVDFEAEVEDDIGPIFRRGEEFEGGIELLVLLQARNDVDPKRIEEGLHALWRLFAEELWPLVIQHTSGVNFSELNRGYTHGIVTRFPSEEAMSTCVQHGSYQEIMEQTLKPITEKIVSLDYPIVPVGTANM